VFSSHDVSCRGEFGRMDDPDRYFHLEPMDKENPSVRIIHAILHDNAVATQMAVIIM
jgi:hypothetical protein